ncbi:MAG: exosortase/archaeosortase family protein [Candidatus Bathyarchaeia archaeon]|nr:exosortase/archaeosortase family protein [Candidatus Bathyarchaeia archaeon]
MLDIVQKFRKNTQILVKLSPVFSFIVPFLILYFLYPNSFEATWKGRTYYLFFLWLVSLEIILGWEEIQTNKVDKLRSVRTFAFIITLLLPTIYVFAANYCGLNAVIADLAKQNNIPWVEWILISTEYLVFTALFSLIILAEFGIIGLKDFSISVFFLGIIGAIYTIDNLCPYGRFTPFQILVPTTTNLAADILNLMGYQTRMSFISNHPVYGSMPYLAIKDSQGFWRGFGIAWPCAGVESLLIYTVTILLFLKKTAIPWKHRMIYFVIGAIVTYFINILRIVTIFVISANGGDVWTFHDYYGQLCSITWIISYPLLIIGSRALWSKIKERKVDGNT